MRDCHLSIFCCFTLLCEVWGSNKTYNSFSMFFFSHLPLTTGRLFFNVTIQKLTAAEVTYQGFFIADYIRMLIFNIIIQSINMKALVATQFGTLTCTQIGIIVIILIHIKVASTCGLYGCIWSKPKRKYWCALPMTLPKMSFTAKTI